MYISPLISEHFLPLRHIVYVLRQNVLDRILMYRTWLLLVSILNPIENMLTDPKFVEINLSKCARELDVSWKTIVVTETCQSYL